MSNEERTIPMPLLTLEEVKTLWPCANCSKNNGGDCGCKSSELYYKLRNAVVTIELLRQDKAELEKQLNKILDNWD